MGCEHIILMTWKAHRKSAFEGLHGGRKGPSVPLLDPGRVEPGSPGPGLALGFPLLQLSSLRPIPLACERAPLRPPFLGLRGVLPLPESLADTPSPL